jgi:branched-chain amino acid transport system permease protein
LAAYFLYTAAHYLQIPLYLSIFLSIFIVTLIGLVCYKMFIKPIRIHESTVLIATLALAMIFQETMLIIFGGYYLGIPPMLNGYTIILGVKVNYQHILAFCVVLIVLTTVWAMLMKTKLGLAIRSVAQNQEIATLMGMDVDRLAMTAFGVSVVLAGIGGAIVAPLLTIEPSMWMHPLIIIMAVIVLGGLGSIKGSFIGAFIMGFSEALVVFLVPMGSFLKGAVALSIMIVVLLFRPEGLFGIAFEEER